MDQKIWENMLARLNDLYWTYAMEGAPLDSGYDYVPAQLVLTETGSDTAASTVTTTATDSGEYVYVNIGANDPIVYTLPNNGAIGAPVLELHGLPPAAVFTEPAPYSTPLEMLERLGPELWNYIQTCNTLPPVEGFYEGQRVRVEIAHCKYQYDSYQRRGGAWVKMSDLEVIARGCSHDLEFVHGKCWACGAPAELLERQARECGHFWLSDRCMVCGLTREHVEMLRYEPGPVVENDGRDEMWRLPGLKAPYEAPREI